MAGFVPPKGIKRLVFRSIIMAHPPEFPNARKGALETFILPTNPYAEARKNLKQDKVLMVGENEAVVEGKTSFWRVIFRKKPSI